MSENQGLDISKVVGLIMENPALIEQIANLAKSKEVPSDTESKSVEEAPKTVENPPMQTSSEATYLQKPRGVQDRSRLLSALKPYVSEERAKAIDSMLTIAEILDMMKAR